MIGTMPTFFKVPVTQQLETAIKYAQYPLQQTVVQTHVPDLPRPDLIWGEGMQPLDNRVHILNCYEAFRVFVEV